MEEFHFLRPLFLWLLLPNILFVLLGMLGINNDVKWKRVIAPHLRPFMISKGNDRMKLWMQFFLGVFLAGAIIGMAGPTWKKIEVPGKLLETPVVIALDMSQSMMSTDFQPNRLERAKFKIQDFLKANPRARVSLIGYSGTAHQIVPLTKDYSIINSHMITLKPSTLPFPGTDLEKALVLSDTIMSVTKATGVLVLFTDEIDEENFELLQNYVKNAKRIVEVVPMASQTGADVPNFSGRGLMKFDKRAIRTNIDSLELRRFEAVQGINISRLTLDSSDMELLAKRISANVSFRDENKKLDDQWEDMGLYFILPLLIFVLFWFRRGMVIYVVFCGFMLTSCSTDGVFADLWYTRDYQAQQDYDKQEYKLAGDKYQSELHKGVAYYKAGDYEKAIQAFSKDTSSIGAYDLGLSYYQNGDYAAAQIAFGRASELDPDMEEAITMSKELTKKLGGEVQVSKKDAQEAMNQKEDQAKKGMQNESGEDLGGGGQEATKKDMEKQRLEETVNTDKRKGKELDEVPEDLEFGDPNNGPQVVMQAVDDDPGLFLKRKFKYQAKKENLKPKKTSKKW